MNNWFRSAVLMTVILSTGCVTSGIEAIGRPSDANVKKHLIIHNEPLADKITISKMRSRTAGDLLSVEITLTNLSSRDMNIQYRFSWYDADDFEVEQGKHSWTPLTLHGYADSNLQALAPSPSVKSYKVNVREIR